MASTKWEFMFFPSLAGDGLHVVVEKIVEKVIEVPIEIIVEKIVEVEKERIIEKIIESGLLPLSLGITTRRGRAITIIPHHTTSPHHQCHHTR